MTILHASLDAEDLNAMGIQGWPFGWQDRVRFSELDPLNHVNNASYLSWFEMARIGYLASYGLTSMRKQPNDPQIVVRRQVVDYLSPVLFGDSYVVTMRTTLVKPSSLVMDYAVHVAGALRATAETVIVGLSPDGSARQNWRPEAVRRMVERDSAEVMGFN